MHHRQRQRRVRPWLDEDHLVSQRLASVRRTSITTIRALRRLAISTCLIVLAWLTVFAPHRMTISRIGAQVLLGRGFHRAGDAQAKSAKPPADHRRVPVLTAIEIGETVHLRRALGRCIIVYPLPCPCQNPTPWGPRRAFCRLSDPAPVPACSCASRPGRAGADQRVSKRAIIADNFMRRFAAHTQKPGAVGVVGSPVIETRLSSSHIDFMPHSVGWQFIGHID